jgi:hypothetical protein
MIISILNRLFQKDVFIESRKVFSNLLVPIKSCRFFRVYFRAIFKSSESESDRTLFNRDFFDQDVDRDFDIMT